MSLKKFISGISALAVAATAFAAMAVTASADTNYGPTDYTTQANKTTVNKSNWDNNGIFTAKAFENGGYAAAYLDFRSLTDIGKATSVTLEFDTYVYNDTVTCYGFGDASQRTSGIATNTGSYRTAGLAAFFGSQKNPQNGTLQYGVQLVGGSATAINGAMAKQIHAKVDFDKTAGTYSLLLTYGKTTVYEAKEVETNISNLTYVDAFTNKSGGNFGFKNIKVSYTVPLKVEASVEEKDAFTVAGGYDNDMVVGMLHVTVKNGTYDLKDAKYNQTQGTVTDTDGNTPAKTEITGDANGTSVVVFAVLKGVDDVAELNNVVFE